MTQPKIPGNGIGIPRMPYGFDGSDWIALLVNALGRLQVDAEVGNFPADPATQTTLALCLVALQKIDDLQGALHDVGDDELDVNVVTAPYPGLGSLNRVASAETLVSSSSFTTILSVSGPGILEILDFSSNYASTELEITIDGDILAIVERDGDHTLRPSHVALNQIGGITGWVKEGVYDAGNNYYSMFLTRVFHYKDTLVIKIRQISGSDKNAAILVFYRLLA